MLNSNPKRIIFVDSYISNEEPFLQDHGNYIPSKTGLFTVTSESENVLENIVISIVK